jgi:hypothetical protein
MWDILGMFELFPTRLPSIYLSYVCLPTTHLTGHLYAGFLSFIRFEFPVCCLCERGWVVMQDLGRMGYWSALLNYAVRAYAFSDPTIMKTWRMSFTCWRPARSSWIQEEAFLPCSGSCFFAGGATSRSAYKVFAIEWLIGRLIVICIVMSLNSR